MSLIDNDGIHFGDGRVSPLTVKMYPSRKYVDPFNPQPGDIDIDDIAHHLANVIRYGGGMATPESVAEHCVYVSKLVARQEPDPKVRLAALLHDASEAYIGDVPRPLKHQESFAAYRLAEEKLMLAVAEHFDLNSMHFVHPVLLEIDREICRWEMAMFRDIEREPMGFVRARELFRDEFFRLSDEIQAGMPSVTRG